MSNLIRNVLCRVSGNVTRMVKHSYHTPSLPPATLKFTGVPSLQNDQAITQLVQRTIIPLNKVDRKAPLVEKPLLHIIEKVDIIPDDTLDRPPVKEIEDPSIGVKIEKKAHRMLRIRRKKMKKHQRRKLRKRMAAVFKNIQKKRSLKKNAAFSSEIISQLREVKMFDAERYVAEKLELYRKTVLPNRIGGVRLPEFAIKERLAKKEEELQALRDKEERRLKMIAERGSLDVNIGGEKR